MHRPATRRVRLDGDRHAGERALVAARDRLPPRRARASASTSMKAPRLRVARLDPAERRLDRLRGGEVAVTGCAQRPRWQAEWASASMRRDGHYLPRSLRVSMSEVQSGLEGVVAFATEIAEPDQRGRRAALPRRRHRGARRRRAVRAGLGPARRRHVRARAAARRAAPAARALRRPARRRAGRAGAARAGVGLPAAHRHRRRARRATTSRARRSWRCRSSPSPRAASAARRCPERGRQGHLDPRALPHPLARRGRSRPRQGDRRLLDLRRRARHERLHVHGARHRLHRRRRGRRAVRRASARCRARCTAARRAAC